MQTNMKIHFININLANLLAMFLYENQVHLNEVVLLVQTKKNRNKQIVYFHYNIFDKHFLYYQRQIALSLTYFFQSLDGGGGIRVLLFLVGVAKISKFQGVRERVQAPPVYRHYTIPTLDLLVIRELSSNCRLSDISLQSLPQYQFSFEITGITRI